MISSLGSYICKTRGSGTFLQVLGLSALGASLAVATDARSNINQVQAGGLGLSAGMMTYGVYRSPAYFALWRFQPLTYMTLILAYGLFYDDKAVIGGLAAGYAAFLMAL